MMEINKLVQFNGKYIKGNTNKHTATLDSLHITFTDGSRKNKFTISELDVLIEELQVVRNELDKNQVTVIKREKLHFYD